MSMKPKVTIQFPNLLLIPAFAGIGIILKSFGLSVYSWTTAVLTLPIALYFSWCIGYCLLAMLAMLVFKLYDKLMR